MGSPTLRMLEHLRSIASNVEHRLIPVFDKAPHIPAEGRRVLVQIAPWLALLGGVLGISAIWATGIFTGALMVTLLQSAGSVVWVLALAVGLCSAVLDLLAFQPLRQQKKHGWNLLFWATLLSGAAAIVQIVLGYSSLGSLLGILIGLWLLFEVRGMYH